MPSFFRDVNLPAATAGFVAVLVGFTSSVAIVFQAAQAFLSLAVICTVVAMVAQINAMFSFVNFPKSAMAAAAVSALIVLLSIIGW